MITASLPWSGPRWAKIPQFIEQVCFHYDLECKTVSSKGLIRESGITKITGDAQTVDAAISAITKAMDEYNH